MMAHMKDDKISGPELLQVEIWSRGEYRAVSRCGRCDHAKDMRALFVPQYGFFGLSPALGYRNDGILMCDCAHRATTFLSISRPILGRRDDVYFIVHNGTQP